MKQLSKLHIVQARAPAVTAGSSDLITSIVDMGSCQNAVAILDLNYVGADPVLNVEFWTSSSDTFIASGTQQTATTNTVKVVIASDTDSLQAWNATAAITGLSVSSNVIASLAADGVYVVELPNIRRYLAAQFSMTSDVSILGVAFIGRDMMEAPYSAARSAYTA